MNLQRASTKAIKYSIMNYHYSKSIPSVQLAYSVFNEDNDFCGVICYGIGANNSIAKPYGLSQGEVIELLRVALNGKQLNTSKAISLSLKLLKKDAPLVKLVVSYADKDQNHKGVIYQASNWYFEGEFDNQRYFIINGVKTHPKTIHSKGIKQNLESIQKFLDKNATIQISKGKYKYIYPIDKNLIYLCEKISKPYPKKNIINE